MQIHIISNPIAIPDESRMLSCLLELGSGIVHLRKPNLQAEELACLMEHIPKKYHSRIILHYHFELSKKFAFGGLHFNRNNIHQREYLQGDYKIGYSAHSVQEIASLEKVDYCFLSPVFDSISKQGYKSNFEPLELKSQLLKLKTDIQVVALGGITPANIPLIQKTGFDGAAVLGYLWNNINLSSSKTKHLAEIRKRYQALIQPLL